MSIKIISYILIPLIITNILHMIIVKKGYLSSLTIPLDQTKFGKNKTWRGIMVVSLVNMLIMGFYNVLFPVTEITIGFLVGLILGLVYVLFELPNSYLKRRLGIKSGEQSDKNKGLFMLLDKSDSALGVSIISALWFNFTLIEFFAFFLISVFIHVTFSVLLVFLGVKRSF